MEENNYHFIGIGGIGMSALATILAQQGACVSGSDVKKSAVTESLEKEGAKVTLGHSEKNVPPGASIVIYSTAVSTENPEYQQAVKQQCSLLHRSELLARLTARDRSLLVAGTHGKTTTSSLLAHLLVVAGLDPSYAIGGVVTSLQANGKSGKGEYFVAEADESDGSFLRLTPFGAIVTNVEQDHMEYWKSEERVVQGFREFIELIQSEKHFFWCAEDDHLCALKPNGISYGFTTHADLHIKNYQQRGWNLIFDLTFEGVKYDEIEVPLIGAYNVLNATAVFGMGLRLKIPEEVIRTAFATFQGIGRRVEKKGVFRGVSIYDDYGHHPTEIFATLRAIKSTLSKERLVVAFQPHRFSRTKECLHQFPEAFGHADRVILTDIYSAGESPQEGASTEALFQIMKEKCPAHVELIERAKLTPFLANALQEGDILITMGAGDITHIGPELMELG